MTCHLVFVINYERPNKFSQRQQTKRYEKEKSKLINKLNVQILLDKLGTLLN